MWLFFDFVSALIQFPRALKDWLIFLASSRVSPVAPVLPTFSEPAKSAKFNFPCLVDPSGFFWWSVRMNRLYRNSVSHTYFLSYLWDLELTAFMLVALTARYFSPNLSRSNMSCSDETYCRIQSMLEQRVLDLRNETNVNRSHRNMLSRTVKTYLLREALYPDSSGRSLPYFQASTSIFWIQEIFHIFLVNFQKWTFYSVFCGAFVSCNSLKDVLAATWYNTLQMRCVYICTKPVNEMMNILVHAETSIHKKWFENEV